ncbi:hypothetical protein HYC85_026562 [Camellia sinensis]|uniref:Uncharacterized protein n=1 Tax=Camellia sinensis TaxID=4442 RepID=A0A7J7G3W9_CAMSI|nr:hypothetical protein HYC85_026562 [Camellia sinensis]
MNIYVDGVNIHIKGILERSQPSMAPQRSTLYRLESLQSSSLILSLFKAISKSTPSARLNLSVASSILVPIIIAASRKASELSLLFFLFFPLLLFTSSLMEAFDNVSISSTLKFCVSMLSFLFTSSKTSSAVTASFPVARSFSKMMHNMSQCGKLSQTFSNNDKNKNKKESLT